MDERQLWESQYVRDEPDEPVDPAAYRRHLERLDRLTNHLHARDTAARRNRAPESLGANPDESIPLIATQIATLLGDLRHIVEANPPLQDLSLKALHSIGSDCMMHGSIFENIADQRFEEQHPNEGRQH